MTAPRMRKPKKIAALPVPMAGLGIVGTLPPKGG